ncbi:MAG: response regulator [Desulfatiglans sp.]|jgi:PAS domain S-box-containing protein|nr:response regulator [Desulfatiglans sp.]
MDSSSIIGMVNNAALLLSLYLLYDMFDFESRNDHPLLRKVLTGIILGCIGIAIMFNPWIFGGGVVFDTRSVLLCISGFFFGPIPVFIAVIMTATLRIIMGGAGVLTGISVIITSASIGIVWKYLRSDKNKSPTLIEFYLLGITVHIVMLICMLWLPWEMAAKVFLKIGLSVMIIYPATTAILAKLILNSEYRKKAEKEIRNSEEHQRAIITASPFAIITLTPDGHVKSWNSAAEEIFGWTEEESIGRCLPIVPDEQSKDYKVLFTQVMNGESFSNIELIRQRKDETFVDVRLSATPVKEKGDNINAIMAVYEDITAQKKAENDKKRLQAQLTQAKKMESVGRLAGGVAHDYNNMLSIILGYTEMALEEVAPDSRLHSDLQQILAAAKRSTDITAQLLAFSRQQTIAPKKLNLNDTIESMLKMLRHLIGEDIELVWRPCKDPLPIMMDPTQIDQILVNLCVNARDAITNVGKIIIETGVQSFDEDYCAIHTGFVSGDFVMFSVSDNGKGMDNTTQEHLFEPFFTTKAIGKGTGLGLATVYGIVKQNNGFINVYSEPGQGTIIRIYLPCYYDESDNIKSIKQKDPNIHGDETILLVEDEHEILRMTTMMLESLGYKVLEAKRPDEAIAKAAEYSNKIHLLITDVIMPDMNGHQLSEELRAAYPDIKILFTSGYTSDVIANRGILDDGVNFLPKPFSKKDLALKVREVIGNVH